MRFTIDSGTPLSPPQRAALRSRIQTGLSRAGSRVRRVSVWLTDVNGPRGGDDQLCRIQVGLVPRTLLLGEGRGATVEEATQAALQRVARRVGEELARRQEHDARRVTDWQQPGGGS